MKPPKKSGRKVVSQQRKLTETDEKNIATLEQCIAAIRCGGADGCRFVLVVSDPVHISVATYGSMYVAVGLLESAKAQLTREILQGF